MIQAGGLNLLLGTANIASLLPPSISGIINTASGAFKGTVIQTIISNLITTAQRNFGITTMKQQAATQSYDPSPPPVPMTPTVTTSVSSNSPAAAAPAMTVSTVEQTAFNELNTSTTASLESEAPPPPEDIPLENKSIMENIAANQQNAEGQFITPTGTSSTPVFGF